MTADSITAGLELVRGEPKINLGVSRGLGGADGFEGHVDTISVAFSRNWRRKQEGNFS